MHQQAPVSQASFERDCNIRSGAPKARSGVVPAKEQNAIKCSSKKIAGGLILTYQRTSIDILPLTSLSSTHHAPSR